MEFEKLCRTCKYENLRCNEEPCLSCRCKSNWVDASTRGTIFNTTTRIRYSPIFKTGDIVVEKNDHRCPKNIYIYLLDNWVLRVPNYVIVRSECDYVFSTYTDKLIDEDFAERSYNLEYAECNIITAHDDRAKEYYITETLNEWFSQLIKKKPTIPQFRKESEKKTKPKVFTTPNMIKKVIFSDPATIVFWEDGTKTVVKTQDGEKYDKEKGLAMAIAKRVFGNERDYYHIFKRWMRKGEERHEET